ncbi:signal peptidase I [Aerococcaceae bacterium DSM 111021]|nr:signal peptidase I [Aerococcaceae bacterium DSM 111021]
MTFKGIIREIISTLIWVAVLFLGIKVFYAYVMEPFIVDGRSMEYTLHDGEKMFMMKLNDIERFDVVVFPAPGGPVQTDEPESLYIKRVIGVPGDSIAYQDDQLILNGEIMNEPYLDEMRADVLGNFTGDFLLENVAGSAVVPEGQVFVMGDNRRNSLDGRAFGFIDAEDIIGEADYIYWPLTNMRALEQYEMNAAGDSIVQRD